MINLKIKLKEGAFPLIHAHEEDVGYDLKSPINFHIPAKGSTVIDTGVCVALPVNVAGMLKSKSGLNVKYGITSEGVIDPGYTGSIVAKLYNNSDRDFFGERGDKITQIVFVPVITPPLEYVDELQETERGENGFGSTGR